MLNRFSPRNLSLQGAIRLLTAGLALGCAVSAGRLAAEDVVFTPLSAQSGGIDMERCTGMWLRPDLGTADQIVPLKTRISATKDSVTGGVAMKILFDKGSTGKLAYELAPDSYKAGSAGITLFAKASRACKLTVAGQEADITTDWKKYDFPWDKVGQTPEKPAWQFVVQVATPIEEPVTLYLDRVGTEGPTFDANPKIEKTAGPDAEISTKDITYGVENLAGALANAKAKKPFKVLCLGDSVTAGAQMNRGTWGVKDDAGKPFLFFSDVARLWEEHFGYKGITPVKYGHGGWTSEQGLGVVDQEIVASVGPDDVVILEFGANDMGWAGVTPDQWKANEEKMIEKIKTKTKNILVLSPTSGGKVPDQAEAITKKLKEIVADEKVCGVDITRMSQFRGKAFGWSYLANEYHPDYCGHIMLAEMIAPALTGDVKNWP